MQHELYVECANTIFRACEAMRMNKKELIQGENGSAHGKVVKIERRHQGYGITVEVWK